MNFQVDDMKVLGAVEGGGRTIKNIKETTRLDKGEIEKILEFLDQSKLIEAVEGKGIWGQRQYYFNTTNEGSQKVGEYIEYLKPKSVLFTHMTALIDEQEVLYKIPSHINAKPGWDGLEIELK